MKEAMLRCVRALSGEACDAGVEARLIAQIHDELLFEVAEDGAAACVAIVRRVMEGMGELDGFVLPRMPVSVTVGRSWGAMEKVP